MARTKKPKLQIKRQKVSLGWAYRIYIDGMYVGTGLTQASAREGVPRMLAIYDRMNEVRKLSAIAAYVIAIVRVTPAPTESWPDATGTVPLVHFVQAFSEAAFRHDHFNAVREVALTGSRAAFIAGHSVSIGGLF